MVHVHCNFIICDVTWTQLREMILLQSLILAFGLVAMTTVEFKLATLPLEQFELQFVWRGIQNTVAKIMTINPLFACIGNQSVRYL